MPERQERLLPLVSLFAVWILVTQYTGPLLRLIPGMPHGYTIPAIRMTLMLASTAAYIAWIEGGAIARGFNLKWQRVAQSLAWAAIFFVVATVAVKGFEKLVMSRFAAGPVEISGAEEPTAAPLLERITAYGYVLYEGIVESLVFIGFLLDRLARRLGWVRALVAGNVLFAAWHYPYLRQGWGMGGMMIALSFLAGVGISLSYVKTRNSFSPVICHTLVDLPSELPALLALGAAAHISFYL